MVFGSLTPPLAASRIEKFGFRSCPLRPLALWRQLLKEGIRDFASLNENVSPIMVKLGENIYKVSAIYGNAADGRLRIEMAAIVLCPDATHHDFGLNW